MTIISDNPVIQAHYERCISEGTSHALAEMFAFQQGPQLNTDTAYMAGKWEQNDKTLDHHRKLAKKAGVSTQGRTYLKSLARYPGDPRAWVDSKGDIRRVCEQEGWGCDGVVKTKLKQEEPPPPVDVAPHLLKKYVAQELAKEPGERVTARKLADTTEKVRNRLKRKRK